MHGYREFLEEAPTLRAFRFKSISDATNLQSGRNRPDGAGGRDDATRCECPETRRVHLPAQDRGDDAS